MFRTEKRHAWTAELRRSRSMINEFPHHKLMPDAIKIRWQNDFTSLHYNVHMQSKLTSFQWIHSVHAHVGIKSLLAAHRLQSELCKTSNSHTTTNTGFEDDSIVQIHHSSNCKRFSSTVGSYYIGNKNLPSVFQHCLLTTRKGIHTYNQIFPTETDTYNLWQLPNYVLIKMTKSVRTLGNKL